MVNNQNWDSGIQYDKPFKKYHPMAVISTCNGVEFASSPILSSGDAISNATMGGFSVFMTFLLGIKFIVRPVMTTKESMQNVSAKKRAIQSIICGVLIGFICGFIGAGGGMMMLLILTSVLGYELKTAVGTSVFIMTFTALTGAVSHFAIGGMPDVTVWLLCILFTFIWARIAAVFANKASAKTLNQATGIILVILGVVVMGFQFFVK